jgi:hypothetical protein
VSCSSARRAREVNLFGIAAHLYHTEPSNLALVALFRSGAIHKICAQPNLRLAKRDFILLMAHLFGRRYLPSACMKEEYITDMVKKSPPMVVLPPLSKAARDVLIEQDSEILQIFTGYALTYGTQHKRTLGPIISSLLAKGIYRVLREMNRRSFTTIFTVRRSLLAFARGPFCHTQCIYMLISYRQSHEERDTRKVNLDTKNHAVIMPDGTIPPCCMWLL